MTVGPRDTTRAGSDADMPPADLPPADTGGSPLARLCARLGGLCQLLRVAHRARVPF